MTSLSTLQREATCPGSAILADVNSTEGAVGSALHAYLEVLVREGQTAARMRAADIAAAWQLDERDAALFYSRAWSFAPDIPPGAVAEVALCLMEDGTVQSIKGGRGRYVMPPGGVIAGTLDLLYTEPEPLELYENAPPRCPPKSAIYVVDWKTGLERYVAPLDHNLQVRIGALMAARWTGATHAVPMICFVDKGPGRWLAPDRALSPDELADLEGEVWAIMDRIREQRRRRAEGQPLSLVTGGHCEWCPSRSQCPAHLSEIRALVTGAPSDIATDLTPAEEAKLVELLAPARRLVEKAEQYLRRRVRERGPIELGGGLVYGPTAETRDVLDVRITYESLAELLGDERADAAFRVSKSALDKAIAAAHEEQGIHGERAPALRALLGAIAKRGGIAKKPIERWRIHPTGTGIPAPEASAPLTPPPAASLASLPERAPSPALAPAGPPGPASGGLLGLSQAPPLRLSPPPRRASTAAGGLRLLGPPRKP